MSARSISMQCSLSITFGRYTIRLSDESYSSESARQGLQRIRRGLLRRITSTTSPGRMTACETVRGGECFNASAAITLSHSIGRPLLIKDVQRRALLIINHKSRDGKSCLKRTKDALAHHGI